MSDAASMPVGLGFRAQRGGAVVVAVAAEGPRVLRSTFLATAAEGDRLAFEPYYVAYEMARGAGGEPSADIVAAVAEGRARQQAMAAKALADLIEELADAGSRPAIAALLVNRAGWIEDLLRHALSAPEHPAVMEGLAVREALRAAFASCGLRSVEMDEKTLRETATLKLPRSAGEIDATLATLGASVGRPWRREQKDACLAAWVAAAGL